MHAPSEVDFNARRTIQRRATSTDRRPLAKESRQVARHRARQHRPHATIDFETKSVSDVTKRGAWLYATDPSTRVLCMAWHLPGMKEPELWHPAFPSMGLEAKPLPKALFKWIRNGGLVEAHNVFFEMCIWHHVCEPMGWPRVPFDNWRCSAAKSAAHALPRSLEEVGDALNLPVKKNPEGKRLINLLCKPKKLTKAEKKEYGTDAIVWVEKREEFEKLFGYCVDDVRAEICVSDEVPDLSDHELAVWQITQRQNWIGVLIDLDLCRAALKLAAKAKQKLNDELEAITGIEGITGTKRAEIRQWLEDNEFETLPDTKAKTLEHFVESKASKTGPLTTRCVRVLEIIREVNRTSINKYKRMIECSDAGGRARELLVYCGAERTGRFAGRGIQVQNLPKGRFPNDGAKGKLLGIDYAVECIKGGDLAWCECMYGDVMNLCASCLRGAIIAPEGRILIAADYAAIEARCVLWEAGATKALEIFYSGGDIYCDMASGIYGYTIVKDDDAKQRYEEANPGKTAHVAKTINSMGSTQRDFGKVAVLGLGYGMGFLKFLITLRTYNIRLSKAEVVAMMGPKRFKLYYRKVKRALFPEPEQFTDDKKYKNAVRSARKARTTLIDELENPRRALPELALCKYTVETYRKRYPEVPEMWRKQEKAAIACIRSKKDVVCGVVTWRMEDGYLTCELPMGRKLWYANAHLKPTKTEWGEVKPGIRFMGRHQKTKRWSRQATYGGKLTENITQAIARDIMCWAKVKLADLIQFDIILDVHDEIICEMDVKEGNQDPLAPANDNYANDNFKDARKLFEQVLADMPACMDGCPIAAEAKSFRRYRK